MSSASVFYKFKSARTPSRITFDGSGISVWDLKRQIMLQNRMGKGTDFDLAVCSAETDEGEQRILTHVSLSTNHTCTHTEYKDDFILPRASSVIARRMPPKKPGHGKAQQYVADLATTGGREDRFGAPNAGGIAPPPPPPPAQPQRGIGGQLSKRFDGKDDVKPGQQQLGVSKASSTRRASTNHSASPHLSTHSNSSSKMTCEKKEAMKSHAALQPCFRQTRKPGMKHKNACHSK